MREHGHGCAVIHDVLQAFFRILRVQRHIRSSSFQHRQQSHDHFHAPLRADAYPLFRLDSMLPQIMRQTVGPPVQLVIAHPLAAEHHRRSLRRALHLGFEQLVNTRILWIFRMRHVPLMQNLLSLCVTIRQILLDSRKIYPAAKGTSAPIVRKCGAQ